jgi:hypothetical protein
MSNLASADVLAVEAACERPPVAHVEHAVDVADHLGVQQRVD